MLQQIPDEKQRGRSEKTFIKTETQKILFYVFLWFFIISSATPNPFSVYGRSMQFPLFGCIEWFGLATRTHIWVAAAGRSEMPYLVNGRGPP